jgi:hypothetical protein
VTAQLGDDRLGQQLHCGRLPLGGSSIVLNGRVGIWLGSTAIGTLLALPIDGMIMLRVSRTQAVTYRLVVNNLSTRLPAGSYVEAAYVGLQDTPPATRFWACTPG